MFTGIFTMLLLQLSRYNADFVLQKYFSYSSKTYIRGFGDNKISCLSKIMKITPNLSSTVLDWPRGLGEIFMGPLGEKPALELHSKVSYSKKILCLLFVV